VNSEQLGSKRQTGGNKGRSPFWYTATKKRVNLVNIKAKAFFSLSFSGDAKSLCLSLNACVVKNRDGVLL
jgi:hypothetical protein